MMKKANEPSKYSKLKQAAIEAEIRLIEASLCYHRWNAAQTARDLGVSYMTLISKMARYGLRRKDIKTKGSNLNVDERK